MMLLALINSTLPTFKLVSMPGNRNHSISNGRGGGDLIQRIDYKSTGRAGSANKKQQRVIKDMKLQENARAGWKGKVVLLRAPDIIHATESCRCGAENHKPGFPPISLPKAEWLLLSSHLLISPECLSLVEPSWQGCLSCVERRFPVPEIWDNRKSARSWVPTDNMQLTYPVSNISTCFSVEEGLIFSQVSLKSHGSGPRLRP